MVFSSLLVKNQVSYFTWALSAHGLKDSVQKYKTHCYSDIRHCNINIYNKTTGIPQKDFEDITSIHSGHSFIQIVNKWLGKQEAGERLGEKRVKYRRKKGSGVIRPRAWVQTNNSHTHQTRAPGTFQGLPALAKARTCRASVGIMCRNRKGSQSS